MNTADAAKDLISLAGGPSIFGVAAVLVYLTSTLSKPERSSQKGWYILGAGALLAAWMVMFISLAAPTVFGSWSPGVVSPTLVLLSATWLIAVVLVVVLVAHAKSAASYLAESYADGEGPWLVKTIRKWLA
jgi:hypothetical protein